MGGFFNLEQTKSVSRQNGRPLSCASCGMYKYVLNPKMKPFGAFKKGILNIGEAPGEEEDKKGEQWQGREGRLLKRTYEKLGIDLFEDCLNINSVNCRPIEDGNNRTPAPHEISCCRKNVIQVIEQYKPKVIVLLGGTAIQSMIGHRFKKDLGGISKWRGFNIPDRDFNAWVCPVYHPSYIMRQERKDTEVIWERDLKKALSMIKSPLPAYVNEREEVEIIKDREDIRKELIHFNMGSVWPDPSIVSFDIETSGLKPHDTSKHFIACMSLCDNPSSVKVFPDLLKRKSQREALKTLLQNPGIGKIAANMKFEETWMNVMGGFQVKPWIWDTMQAAHVLDNRPEISGLKFQTYVNFGVVDYSSEISSFLEGGDSKNANSVNRISELLKSPEGEKKLFTYCGMDSLFEYRLALLQMERMGVDVKEILCNQ